MEIIKQDTNVQHGKYHVDTNIRLNELEQRILTTIMEVVRDNDLKTTVRVAGGWVRDKLMGKESVDIDLALDDMYGQDFAKLLNTKLYPEGQTKYGVIKSNSDKSKHLETATIRVHGVFIDIANLRNEKYTEESRVPVIEIGTPEEDAYRRDLTINSMFYNVNKGEIEDFTKYGLMDLENGVVRTPMEPLQTFLDDPLRVLRTIRFATRFGFKIVDEIFEAVKDNSVRDALKLKVSFERLGKEMDLMLGDKFPHDSIKLLYDFGIVQLLYKFPENCEPLQDSQLVQRHILESVKLSQVLGYLYTGIRAHADPNTQESVFASRKYQINEAFKDYQRNSFFSALMLPFFPYEYLVVKKKKNEKVVNLVMADSLKKSNDQVSHVMKALPFVDQAIAIVNEFQGLSQLEDSFKLKAGNLIRETGKLWDTVYQLAIAKEYCSQNYPDISKVTSEFDIDGDKLQILIDKYAKFNEMLIQERLDQADQIKPLIDGKAVCELYEMKPGKALKFLLEEEINYQILHPQANYAEMEEYLRQNKEAFMSKYS